MAEDARIAVVTGGAQGIGRAICQKLSASGVRIAVVDRHDANEVVSALPDPEGSAAFVCDVTSPDEVERLRGDVETQLGGVAILVNNVGTYPPMPFAELTYDFWRKVQTINADSMFLMARAFAPPMAEAGWGRIINLSSSITFSGIRDHLAYMASKGTVNALTRGLANELGAQGVTVNAIGPSIVPTEGVFARERVPLGLSHEEELDIVASMQAIPRKQRPEDVANAVAFLASDDAEFITAQILHVDGGLVRSGA